VLEALALAAAAVLVPCRLVRRAIRPRPLSVWTGAPILNMAFNARAERLLGCDTLSMVTRTYFITSEFDVVLSKRFPGRTVDWIAPFASFLYVVLFADRLHFYCDRTLLTPPGAFGVRSEELRVYRWLGIPVFFWTYGADVRTQTTTRALGEPNCCTECDKPGIACVCDEEKHRRNWARIRAGSTAQFSMGDMIEYTPGSRNDLFFWPVDFEGAAERYRPSYPDPTSEGPLRVAHAPNHRVFKGTRFLVDAVEKLRREGVAIELDLIERISNQEALERYRQADVIFDQCLIGFHGFLAIEGMAMGKPVMCFVRKPSEYLLDADSNPILRTGLGRLSDDLRRLAEDRARVAELGRRSRAYAERYFSFPAFASRLARAYRDFGIPVPVASSGGLADSPREQPG
jgi:glycosyltransferase involved in cell wall biosynthesis